MCVCWKAPNRSIPKLRQLLPMLSPTLITYRLCNVGVVGAFPCQFNSLWLTLSLHFLKFPCEICESSLSLWLIPSSELPLHPLCEELVELNVHPERALPLRRLQLRTDRERSPRRPRILADQLQALLALAWKRSRHESKWESWISVRLWLPFTLICRLDSLDVVGEVCLHQVQGLIQPLDRRVIIASLLHVVECFECLLPKWSLP